VHDGDLEWDIDRFVVKGAPEQFKTMAEIAYASYNQAIPGVEPGLEAVSYYDPPNMTYPFGAYICVMEIDVDTGTHDIRQFYALDDCGTRINPMIIEGQVHGGLTEALAIAMGQELAYDEIGNVKTGTLMVSSSPPHGKRRPIPPTLLKPPARTIRSVPKGWAKARMSAACPRFQTRSMTHSARLDCGRRICPTITGGSGRSAMIWACTTTYNTKPAST